MNVNNIYLTGMMGSGKSSVGKILAKHLRFSFVDLDVFIESKSALKISQIFELFGEKTFRIWEKEALLEIHSCNYTVIATGGGSILEEDNRKIMQQSGMRFFLETSIDVLHARLQNSQNRPLLSSDNSHKKLTALFLHRIELYRECEMIFDTRQLPSKIASKIEKYLLNSVYG